MDFNTDLGQATKLGARLTVLAMAVSLAACGGGGASDAVVSGVVASQPTDTVVIEPAPPISQERLSLSFDSNNIEGWDLDGVRSNITLRVADKFGNAVPEGAIVSFTAEGGQINSSCTIKLVDGFSQCSVAFESQQFRPTDGRVTILAVVDGQKSYVDNNQNNRFDAGDTLNDNIGDTFRDDNENGMYDAGEYIHPVRTGATGACASNPDLANQPNISNTCTATLDAPLRVQAVLLLAGSTASIQEKDPNASNLTKLELKIGSSRPLNLPMPGGTVISGTVIKGTTDSKCAIVGQSGESTIPSVIDTKFIATFIPTDDNTTLDLSTTHGFSLKECRRGDAIAVKAVTPKGRSTEVVFPLR